MTESNNLRELYARKSGFAAFRLRKEAELRVENNPANALHEQLSAKKAEKRALMAKIDYEIATIKMELQGLGVPISKTERTKQLAEQLRDEKSALDAAFTAEVNSRLQRGATVQELIKECGASTGTVFYNASRAGRVPEQPIVAQEFSIDSEEWAYSEHSGVHRYALNQDMTLVRFHAVEAEDESLVLAYPSCVPYAGNRSLFERFDKNRAETLEKILSGTYDGLTRFERNPYSEGN